MSHHQPLAADASIENIVDSLAPLLPEQAPLHTFVHHNTLHSFEHLTFDAAVLEASQLYGTQPYQSEEAFAKHLRTGRILSSDINEVVRADLTRQTASPDLLPHFSKSDFRIARLMNLFEVPRGKSLEWQLLETDLLRRPHPSVDATRTRELHALANRRHANLPHEDRLPALLKNLWQLLADNPSHDSSSSTPPRIRRRDQLMAVDGGDIDRHVHPMLIRLSAAFLDQGVASWQMPDRDQGFLHAVRKLYGQRANAPDQWSAGLAAEFRQQQQERLDAEATSRKALERLGIAEADWPDYIRATLLSLRGWAGMMRQFETRPDRAPVAPLPARLVDYLAVQLTLEAFAASSELRDVFGKHCNWNMLTTALPANEHSVSHEHTFEAFVLSQIAGVDIDALSTPNASASWLQEVQSMHGLERRRLLHQAYERRLRIQLLDGIAAHSRQPPESAPKPRVQAVFCIDDRECSTRRHLEEVMPDAETFGYAGFFGVAMAWQGLGEIQSRPLCPVNVTPEHYVTERALNPQEEVAWREARRRRGLATRALTQGSRQVAGGGLLSTFFGWWSAIPMIGRCLFPRATAKLLPSMTSADSREPVTRLVLERTDDERDSSGRKIGYSVSEMTDLVESLLRTIALTNTFCEIILIVGHGSSSQNNPHEAAYDCGATGGGRGGPNARAFAAMANHKSVREQLAQRGIAIPESTWFVGCYHNTCDDSMTWFDEDLMPVERQPALESIKEPLASACTLDAHERCRRFESAPHDHDPNSSLRHAEGRSVDIAQPRPECGHATNAYAIVGRRSRTRGLFLDRRAFLVSYDPSTDEDGALLDKLLGAVVPVGAGINLEYYFSFIDSAGYGCGSKLPHNITGLFGVMDGHSSDLRTGLPWQMVEIHEPVRLQTVVEAEPELLEQLLKANPEMDAFIRNGWIHLMAWSPSDDRLWEYIDGSFHLYEPESKLLPTASSSSSFHRQDRDHLGCARIVASHVTHSNITGGR